MAKIKSTSKDVRRLFAQFQPSHYDLSLELNPDDLVFSGRVVIMGKKVGKPSRRLTLHQKDLQISSAKVTHHHKKADQAISVSRINSHNRYDELRLHAESTLYPGSYTVTIDFSGRITEQMDGIYPCYFEIAGIKQKIIATQFESHYARQVFPCIDEPEAKAVFELTLTTPAGLTLLSNTEVVEESTVDSKQSTVFAPTPEMSTYLLAFICGNLSSVEAKTKSGVRVSVWSTSNHSHELAYALKEATACLDFYEDYFGIPYPLSKCDLIALPDFASGAMENWGAITFREHGLCIDPKNSSASQQQYVSGIIAHELAHQWFGNLVTMRWWTDLWLNEGFASWMTYLTLDALHPEWDMWTQFITDDQHYALLADSLANTHPVIVPVHHPDEIRTIFDTISYDKGASLIHMLYKYIAAESFRRGLYLYLSRHAYNNTDTQDLWAALEEASNKPVTNLMQTWTTQSGFPVIMPDNTQRRFYQNPLTTNPDETTQWPIPESDSGGFYYTIYPTITRNSLTRKVQNQEIPPTERLEFLINIFETTKAGHWSTIDSLDVLKNMNGESNGSVWEIIIDFIAGLRAVMGEEVRSSSQPFVRKLISSELSRLGWEAVPGEAHHDSLLRPMLLGLASSAEDQKVINKALEIFDTARKPEEVTASLRSVVYGTTARERGSQKIFDELLKYYRSSDSSPIRLSLTSALCSFENPKLITQALDLIQTNTIRNQDVFYWISYSLSNRHATLITWTWIQDNWKWLTDNLETDHSYINLPKIVARNFNSQELLSQYQDFFAPRLTPSLQRSYDQGIEMIEWRSEWKRRDYKSTLVYFSKL